MPRRIPLSELIPSMPYPSPTARGKVIWGKGRWAVPNRYFGCWFESDLFFDDFAGHKQEVIGNIYDNPELLKDNGEESI